MSFGTFIGALIGAVLIYLMSAGVLKKLLPLVILLAAVYLIWPRRARRPPSLRNHRCRPTPSGAASSC